MNDQALQTVYQYNVSKGYGGTIQEFAQLLQEDQKEMERAQKFLENNDMSLDVGKLEGALADDAAMAPTDTGLASGDGSLDSPYISKHIAAADFSDISQTSPFYEGEVVDLLKSKYSKTDFEFEEAVGGYDSIKIRHKTSGQHKTFMLPSQWNMGRGLPMPITVDSTVQDMIKFMDEAVVPKETEFSRQVSMTKQAVENKLSDDAYMKDVLGRGGYNFESMLDKGDAVAHDDYTKLSKALKEEFMDSGWFADSMKAEYSEIDEYTIEGIINDAVTAKANEIAVQRKEEQAQREVDYLIRDGKSAQEAADFFEKAHVDSSAPELQEIHRTLRVVQDLAKKVEAGEASQADLDAAYIEYDNARSKAQTWWNETQEYTDPVTGFTVSKKADQDWYSEEHKAAGEKAKQEEEELKKLLENNAASMAKDRGMTAAEIIKVQYDDNNLDLYRHKNDGKEMTKIVLNDDMAEKYMELHLGIMPSGMNENGYIYEVSKAQLAEGYDYIVASDGFNMRGFMDLGLHLAATPQEAVDIKMKLQESVPDDVKRKGHRAWFKSPDGHMGFEELSNKQDWEEWSSWWWDEDEYDEGDFSKLGKIELKRYRDEGRELRKKKNVLGQMHLFNKDVTTRGAVPEAIGVVGEQLRVGFGGMLGLDIDVDPESMSARTEKDVVSGLVDEGLIEETEAIRENVKRGTAMRTVEGVSGFVPAITEFAIVDVAIKKWGAVTGIPRLINNMTKVYRNSKGVRLTEKALRAERIPSGGKILKYGDEGFDSAFALTTGGTVKVSNLQRGIGFTYEAIMEEVKMKAAFDEDYHMGGGVAFLTGGKLMNKLVPLTSRYAGLNEVIKIGRSGVSGMFSTQAAANLEALVRDIKGGETMQRFLEENYSDLDETGHDALVDFLVFSIIGGKGHIMPGVKHATHRATGGRYGKESPLFMTYQKLNRLDRIARHKVTQWGEILEADPKNAEALENYEKYLELYQGVNAKIMELDSNADWQDPQRSREMVERQGKSLVDVMKKFGIELEFETTTERENKDGSKKFDHADSVAEYKPLSKGKAKIIIDTTKLTRGKLPHEAFHLAMDAVFGENVALREGFKKAIVNSFEGIKFDITEKEKDGTVKRRKVNLEEFITLNYSEHKDFEKIKADEFLGYVTEILTEAKYRDQIFGEGTFERLRQDINKFSIERFGKAPLTGNTMKQQVLDFLGTYARSVKSGSVSVKQLEKLRKIAEDGGLLEHAHVDTRSEERKVEHEIKDLEEQIKDSESLQSKDFDFGDTGTKVNDPKQLAHSFQSYYEEKAKGGSNTIDDYRELMGQKLNRAGNWDLDFESPYTDFEKYPILGNVLGPAFDMAVAKYQRTIPERYRVNMADRSFEGERAELAMATLADKRAWSDIFRTYSSEKGKLMTHAVGILGRRMQEIKARSVDLKYESRAAEAEGAVVSGTDISEINMDFISGEATGGGVLDKGGAETPLFEKAKGIQLKEVEFTYEDGVKRKINPESVARIKEAGKEAFNEMNLEDLTYVKLSQKMRGATGPEMDLLFRGGKTDLKGQKGIEQAEKPFTDNVDNAAILYDAMHLYSNPKFYENTNFGKTVFKKFYKKTGETFTSDELPAELAKKTTSRTDKFEKMKATPEVIEEFIDTMNQGRDARTRNGKRTPLKQAIGDVLGNQLFREMLTDPKFIEEANSTPEGKAKLLGIQAGLALHKLRGATPENLASKGINLESPTRVKEDLITVDNFIREAQNLIASRAEDPISKIKVMLKDNASYRDAVENLIGVDKFLKDILSPLEELRREATLEEISKIVVKDKIAESGLSEADIAAVRKAEANNIKAVLENLEKAGVEVDKSITGIASITPGKASYNKDLRDRYLGFMKNVYEAMSTHGLNSATIEALYHQLNPRALSEGKPGRGASSQDKLDLINNILGTKLEKTGSERYKDVHTPRIKDINKIVGNQVQKFKASGLEGKALNEAVIDWWQKRNSPSGDISKYEAVVEANKKFAVDYMEILMEVADKHLNGVEFMLLHLQQQTNNSYGVSKALGYSMRSINVDSQKLYLEHELQLVNLSRLLTDAYVYTKGKPAQLRRDMIKAALDGSNMSLIPKSHQQVIDVTGPSATRTGFRYAMGKDGVSVVFESALNVWENAEAARSQVITQGRYKYMSVADALLAEATGAKLKEAYKAAVKVKPAKRSAESIVVVDRYKNRQPVEKAIKVANKQLVRDGLASKNIKLSEQEIKDIAAARDEAIRLGRLPNKKKKGMSTWDFDDTLAKTKSDVLYTTPEGKKGRLNATEFAKRGAELLDKGYEFDFSEFNKVKDGKPGPFLEKALKRAKKFGVKDQFILTARAPEAAPAIKAFLDAQGFKLPIENIIGLGNSTPEAKARWMLKKFAEGYNDMYFADDALKNVKAVKSMLDNLDVKSKVQQALASKNLGLEINQRLQHSLGIEVDKEFTRAEGSQLGKKSTRGFFNLIGGSRRRVFVPDTAADLELLLEPLYGKGKRGLDTKQWFADNLYRKFERGINDYNTARQRLIEDYQQLRADMKDVVKELGSDVPNTNFTLDQAIRVHIWDRAGFEIPDLSESNKQILLDHIRSNQRYLAYAYRVSKMTGIESGLKKPSQFWWGETLANEISDVERGVDRKGFLADFIEAKEAIFSEKNLNKMESKLGANWRMSIEDMFDRMETGRTRAEKLSGTTANIINYFNGSIGTIMNWNTRSAVLQTISAINFVNASFNNPLRAAQAMANAPQYARDFMRIMNSDMLKQRRGGLQINVTEAEIAKAAESTNPAKAIIAKLLKAGYTPTKIMDSFAIASGGATYYRNAIRKYMKEGMTKAEAEKQAWLDFQEIAERTQQSNRADLISKQQTTLGGRLILPFANTPMQMNRIMMKELLDIKNGRFKDKADLATKLGKFGYYGFVQSLVFAGLQSAAFAVWNWSDDEELKAEKQQQVIETMSDGLMRGQGIKGAILNGVFKASKVFLRERKKGFKADYSEVWEALLGISPPVGAKVRQLDKMGNTYSYNKKHIEENGFELGLDSPSLELATLGAETFVNIPANRMLKKARNVEAAMEEDRAAWERVLLALGWSEWDVDPERTREELKERRKEQEAKSKPNKSSKPKKRKVKDIRMR